MMWYRKLYSSLLLASIVFTAQADFKSWLSSKLPYKLPPEKLQFASLRPPSAVEVLDRNNQRLFYFAPLNKLRFYRNLSEISEDLQKFVVLSEDAKFFSHEGFDVEEIENSLKKNLSQGKVKRGGSTITQQLAKNVFLDKKRSVTRKLFEVPWTMQIERDLNKKQILELYLNIIEWGPGIYGAEAASRHFFDKSAAELDPKEALYLAMIIPNPIRFDGFKSSKSKEFIWSKSKTFAQRIHSEKKISLDEKNYLVSEPATLALLDNKTRKYPLQHTSSYAGSPKDFQSTWQDLATHIRKTKHAKENPVYTFLDKEFDTSIFNVPFVESSKEKNAPTPYLVLRDEKGVVAYKKLTKGTKLPEGYSLSDGLSLENDFSLEEVFYGRPTEPSSSSSETMERPGEEQPNSSMGPENI